MALCFRCKNTDNLKLLSKYLQSKETELPIQGWTSIDCNSILGDASFLPVSTALRLHDTPHQNDFKIIEDFCGHATKIERKACYVIGCHLSSFTLSSCGTWGHWLWTSNPKLRSPHSDQLHRLHLDRPPERQDARDKDPWPWSLPEPSFPGRLMMDHWYVSLVGSILTFLSASNSDWGVFLSGWKYGHRMPP